MSEMISLQEKKNALSLAYQIVTDKRNVNRYGCTALFRKDSSEMFTYGDMTRVLNGMYKELVEAPVKPMTLEELHALIDAGDEVVIYCEARDDDRAYVHICAGELIISSDGDIIAKDRLVYATYGKTWRAWASRPTDEERAAAPWEE